MDNIDIRIDFWIDLWEDLISNFLKKSYGLSLYNPHILIEDIITEIEENSFQNSDNKKYFFNKISFYLNNDTVIKEKFSSQFKILLSIFNSGRNNYILEISKNLKKEFLDGVYFNSCVELLNHELQKPEEITISFVNSITYLSQNIIVEYIKKGYVLDDIKKFALNIFSSYKITQNVISTKYPHSLDTKNYIFKNGRFNHKKYNLEVSNLIDNLTIADRINSLLFYYYKEKKTVNYIFIVTGLKGSIDIQIGETTLYTLDKKRFITNPDYFKYEDLHNKEQDEKFIQASVQIDNYLLPKSSLINALTKLENTLDLVSCYFKKNTEIEIIATDYLIVEKGEYIYSSWGLNKKDNHIKYRDSLDLNDFENDIKSLNDFSFLWDNENFNEKGKSKLLNAIHWYSKAEQSVKQEDKMLNYWIAIENLFNLEYNIKKDILNDEKKGKIHLIQEIISSAQIFKYAYDYGWEVYRHYESQVKSFNKKIHFPQELIIKANLNQNFGENIYLEKFIICLPEIKTYEKDLFMLQKIENTISFYSDSKLTKKNIEENIKLIKEDVLMIYRFRNLIVHNAHFDNALLPYFVWKVRDYSGNLIRQLIKVLSENDIELANTMINFFLRKECFLHDLDTGKLNLFDNI
ncbi:hypothetical protein EYY60_16595 [Flavobacterium zhairuonense]|uniref:hypothetical protein n=1 Tax=Flavobacterium zhairuonense TaxID=2493631 RepID=UPI001047590B|nr:hypothetical protein [Flavobacterium zhairuonense]KAF2508738.1 hypothetical protein EYY60_16595 [Flavobacterium zhairuonense]